MVKRYSAKPQSTRQIRVAELIQNIVSDMIVRGEITHILPIDVNISAATVSADLRYATIYISPCPAKTGKKAKTPEKIIANLHNSRKKIKSHIASKMTSRVCPEIEFEQDMGTKHANKIDKILSK